MTIPSEVSRMDYVGNGVTTVFAYSFKIFDSSHLVVTKLQNEVESTMVETTDYSVSGVGDDAGGNVTMVVAPANGVEIVFRRVVPIIQDTDIKNQSAFFPEVHENAFDKAIMILQNLKEEMSRAVIAPVTGAPSAQVILDAANIAAAIHGVASKATPVNADELGIWDSVSLSLRKLTWANLKATLTTAFNTVYAAIAGSATQDFAAQNLTAVTIKAEGVSADPSVVARNTGSGIDSLMGKATADTIAEFVVRSQWHNINDYSAGWSRWIANSSGVLHATLKSSSSTPGTRLAVVNGDDLYHFDHYGVDSALADILAARMSVEVDGVVGSGIVMGRYIFSTADAAGVLQEAMRLDSTQNASFKGALKSIGAQGYSTGAGSTVTQATSKSTAVTLDKVCGAITMNAAALAANTAVAFTFNNSNIAATDIHTRA